MKSRRSPPPHPNRRIGIGYCVTSGITATAAIAVAPVSATTALALGLFAACTGGLGVLTLRGGPAVQLCNTAFNALSRGDLDEAEALLDAIPTSGRRGAARRSIAVQRALIALRRGDALGAAAHATTATEGRSSVFTRQFEAMQEASALGVRATARATLGDFQGAMSDAIALRARPDVTPDALARGAIAEAIILSRKDDREALAALLARDRKLLLEYAQPRERALVRALQRMLRARPTTAYREPAKRETDAERDPTALASWIATVAPAAAAFATETAPSAVATAPLPPEAPPPREAVVAVEKARAQAAKGAPTEKSKKTLAVWVLLVILFLAIWQLFSGETPPPDDPQPPLPWDVPGSIALFFVVTLVAVVAWNVWRGNVWARRLLEASRLFALGDTSRAEQALDGLTRAPISTIAGNAHLQLAYIAERRGDLASALAHCDRGIGVLTKTRAAKIASSDILLPELAAERAFVLAAMDRPDEASAELAALATAHPAFPFAARSQLRVRLVQAVRCGDLPRAAALARERTPDLPLTLRDEMLADLVIAASEKERLAEGELERLREEMRVDDELRAWLARVAPAAAAAVTAR